MIRRWLDRLADRLMDTGWLRQMRARELHAKREARHIERRQRKASWPENTVYPGRGKRGQP